MSVIFFGAEDLGEVVAALPPTFDKTHACEVLAKYSIANARAYTRSYPHESCTPHTSEEIKLASNVAVDEPLERWQTRRRRAESTAALLIYNAIANDGTCFLDDIDRVAIIELEMATRASPSDACASGSSLSLTRLRVSAPLKQPCS